MDDKIGTPKRETVMLYVRAVMPLLRNDPVSTLIVNTVTYFHIFSLWFREVVCITKDQREKSLSQGHATNKHRSKWHILKYIVSIFK